MALIRCKECGKEMSDTVRKCPHCGYVNKERKKEQATQVKESLKSKKGLIISIVIILVVIVVGIVVFSMIKAQKEEEARIQAEIIANTLNEDEKKVAKVVKEYQNDLKNPDSMQIFEIRFYKDDNYVLIDSSGQNGFGGTTRNIVQYDIDGEYWGNDSEADRTISKYTDFEDSLEIALSKAIQERWQSNKNYIEMDKDKIVRNLDQADL